MSNIFVATCMSHQKWLKKLETWFAEKVDQNANIWVKEKNDIACKLKKELEKEDDYMEPEKFETRKREMFGKAMET